MREIKNRCNNNNYGRIVNQQGLTNKEAQMFEEERIKITRQEYLKTQQSKMLIVLTIGVILSELATYQL